MAAKPRILIPDGLYHVTVRCNNKEWFAIPLPEVWATFELYLHFIRGAYQVEVQAFVLMSNHFHLLIKTAHPNLDQAMQYLLRETSRRIGFLSKRINHVFARRYHPTLIEDENARNIVYKYIYRNPVAAGMVRRVEHYPFSSLQVLLGRESSLIPVVDPLNIADDPGAILEWLNEPVEDDSHDVVRRALKRPTFEIKSNPKS